MTTPLNNPLEYAHIIVPVCLLIIVALLGLTAYEWLVEHERRRLQSMCDKEFSEELRYNPTGRPFKHLHDEEFKRRYADQNSNTVARIVGQQTKESGNE